MVVIVIISVLTGFAMLRMNLLQPDTADGCAQQARNWFTGLADKASASDATIYISSSAGHWQSFVLGRSKAGKLVAVPLTKLSLDSACSLTSTHGANAGNGTDRLPEALAHAWLAVTADGRWLARDGSAKIELTDASGTRRKIDLGQLGVFAAEEGQ